MSEDIFNLRLTRKIMKPTMDGWFIFREALDQTESLCNDVDEILDYTKHLKNELIINIILNYDMADKENKVDTALQVIEQLKKQLIDMDKHIISDDGVVNIEGFE